MIYSGALRFNRRVIPETLHKYEKGEFYGIQNNYVHIIKLNTDPTHTTTSKPTGK